MEYPVHIKKEVDFNGVPKAEISIYKWTEGYAPYSYGQLILVQGQGFALRMCSRESNPKCVYTEYNQPVYKDSCLEFFVSFNPESPLYMNFEMNSTGAFLAGIRSERSNKKPIHDLIPLPRVTAAKEDGWWSVETFFAFEQIECLFGKFSFETGSRFKGNFYKCGDETEHPHFGMWSEVLSDKPDFHRPEFFGEFIII